MKDNIWLQLILGSGLEYPDPLDDEQETIEQSQTQE